jgi:23S rRNA pseudouridine2605 synthase
MPTPNSRTDQRIAKLLARAGIASRREIERMIAEGRVAIDGTVIATPATLVTSLRAVTVDGQPVAAPAPARLFLFHKPAGVLTTERDPGGRPTIYDRLPKGLPRVVPVGRLDLNTEGLLLLTTDGGLKRQLELPSTGVERTYRARAYGQVTQEQLEDLIEGVEVDGMRYGSIDANLERRTGANVWIEMTLTEGKNREVRRVLEHLGLKVGRLIRTRYGPFALGDMPVGAVGEVRQVDLINFRGTLTKKRDLGMIAAVPFGEAPASKRQPRPSPPPGASPQPQGHAGDTPRAKPTRAHTSASRPAPGDVEPKRARAAASTPANRGEATKRFAQASRPAKPGNLNVAPKSSREAKDAAGAPQEGATHTARSPRPPKRKAGWAKPKAPPSRKPRPKRP